MVIEAGIRPGLEQFRTGPTTFLFTPESVIAEAEAIISQAQKPGIDSVSATRNSFLRQSTKGFVENTARFLYTATGQGKPDEERPFDLSPNHVTGMGILLVLAGTYLAEEQKANPFLPFVFEGLGYYCDGLDGALARLIMSKDPSRHDSKKGQVIDMMADRIEEVGTALLRARSAYKRGDAYGEMAAYGVALTTCLPSCIRALSESKGISVPETGKNFFEMLGTRPGRILLAAAGTHLNPYLGYRVQPVTDTLGTIANLNTTRARVAILRDPNASHDLSDSVREEARIRGIALGGVAVAGAAASVLTYKALRLHESSVNLD